MPMAALLQFTPLYHAFHDMHGVHTEVCVCVIVGLYVMLAWSGDRGTGMEARNGTQGAGEVLVLFYTYILLWTANLNAYQPSNNYNYWLSIRPQIKSCSHNFFKWWPFNPQSNLPLLSSHRPCWPRRWLIPIPPPPPTSKLGHTASETCIPPPPPTSKLGHTASKTCIPPPPPTSKLGHTASKTYSCMGVFQDCVLTITYVNCHCTGHRKRHSVFNELSLAVVIHYLFYIVLVFVASPESYRSTGPHETVGDCDSVSTINTVTGLVSTVWVNPHNLSVKSAKSLYTCTAFT